MPIELIQKQTSKDEITRALKFKSWISLFAGVLVLSLICYGGLFGYKSYLNRTIDKLDKEIEDISQKRDHELEERVRGLSKRIADMKRLMADHFYWSKLFSVIEKLTLRQLYFSSFEASIDDPALGSVSFTGSTVNFNKGASELKLFKDDPFFSNVEISSLRSGEKGEVDFKLDAQFDPGDLKSFVHEGNL